MVNKCSIPSGGNHEELVLDVVVERDEAAMIVSVLHSSLSMIAPVMTHEASPSSWRLPEVADVVILCSAFQSSGVCLNSAASVAKRSGGKYSPQYREDGLVLSP